ncbi:hypothetical protein ACS0TY_018040 [Phlomoides rotata]
MEHSSAIQLPSPNSRSSASSTSSSTTANGLHHQPITRSEPNSPYPTTFVQADTSSFKQVVQMLTGSNEAARRPDSPRHPIPPIKTGPRKDKSASSRLYERRNSFRNFKISPLGNTPHGLLFPGYSASPRPEILSPSILDFPSLMLSPVTPLIPDPFNREVNRVNTVAEDKAIKEKGFYLHPSPATTPRESEPRLLPLFPVTSPRVAGSSNAAD